MTPDKGHNMAHFKRWLTAVWAPKRRVLVRRHHAGTASSATAPSEDDAPPKGCGWFDSSHELMRGLVVQEMHLR